MVKDNMNSHQSSKSPIAVTVICISIVLLAAIGSWVYIQQKQLAQRDRETQQKAEADRKEQEESLKHLKFQECEAGERAARADSNNIFGGGFENCENKL